MFFFLSFFFASASSIKEKELEAKRLAWFGIFLCRHPPPTLSLNDFIPPRIIILLVDTTASILSVCITVVVVDIVVFLTGTVHPDAIHFPDCRFAN